MHKSMTRKQALDLLGLKEGYIEVDFDKARKAALKKHHPDLGGDVEIFKSIPQAINVLRRNTTTWVIDWSCVKKPHKKRRYVTKEITCRISPTIRVILEPGTGFYFEEFGEMSKIYVIGIVTMIPTKELLCASAQKPI